MSRPRCDIGARARQSLGASDQAIYRAVASLLEEQSAGGVLADVGCGTGSLWPFVAPRFDRCIGVDVVRYEGLPGAIDFRPADLDAIELPIETDAADVTVAAEVIEHLENPRAFVRELARVTRPGGRVIVSTPNQLSLLSLLTLLAKGQFSAFQENAYPAHRTALLEIDLRRIAAECGLQNARIRYTMHGRVPLTGRHYPVALSSLAPRALSDNIILSAVKAA